MLASIHRGSQSILSSTKKPSRGKQLSAPQFRKENSRFPNSSWIVGEKNKNGLLPCQIRCFQGTPVGFCWNRTLLRCAKDLLFFWMLVVMAWLTVDWYAKRRLKNVISLHFLSMLESWVLSFHILQCFQGRHGKLESQIYLCAKDYQQYFIQPPYVGTALPTGTYLHHVSAASTSKYQLNPRCSTRSTFTAPPPCCTQHSQVSLCIFPKLVLSLSLWSRTKPHPRPFPLPSP